MYPTFNHWAHWSHMLPMLSMFLQCAQWVFGPLSPVRTTWKMPIPVPPYSRPLTSNFIWTWQDIPPFRLPIHLALSITNARSLIILIAFGKKSPPLLSWVFLKGQLPRSTRVPLKEPMRKCVLHPSHLSPAIGCTHITAVTVQETW